ncbi:MAG: helix-turn-helix domain-containing protein [Chloroflexi bacterium]|nr:MAG: helix-turn-helix domain-containing protein [Chloroflexota bacterium]
MPNNNIDILRAKYKFSQQELAEKVGAAPLTVGRWERGEAVPRKYFLMKLCEIFKCSEEELGFSTGPGSLTGTDGPQDLVVSLHDVAIPLAMDRFVGREHDLKRIKAALRETESSVVFVALNGIPGVGKTSLAITLAHDPEVREYFSDGILWASLGPTPNLAGLLRRWARLFGIPETQFAEFDEDQKRQALRTAIGTRSMLLVLDDAWKAEHALALQVGGNNCAYLMTTRFPAMATQLAAGNALMIEELNEEQSVHLLRVLAREVVDREETKVRELVHAVGGLPLALTLLGNYLRKQAYHHSARRTAAALERLSNVNERFKVSEPHLQAGTHPTLPSSVAISLSSIIEVSDHFLTSQARETLYALSVFPPKPQSFSEEAALCIAACTPSELYELVDAGLLEYQQGADERYRLHRTIADYAHLHLWEQTKETVILRLLAYMQQYVSEHAKVYELLEQEITLILYALEKAVTGAAFQAHIVPLVCAATPFLLMRGYIAQAERFLERAYELATASHESAKMAKVLLFLGEISQKRGNLSRAKELYKQGKVLAESISDIGLLVAFYHDIGRMSWKMGNYQEAETLLQEGMTFAQAIERPELVCDLCTAYSALYADSANYQQAEAYAREGLAIVRALGDRERIIALLINLGCSLQPSPEKPASFHEALLLAREIRSDEDCCLVLINLSDWYTNSTECDLPQAEGYLCEAISIARRLGITEWTSAALAQLTIVLRLQGRLSEAEACAQEAFTLAKEIQRPRMMCTALDEIGNLALVRGNAEQALEAFQEMSRLCPQGDAEVQAMSLFGLGRAYEQLEQHMLALSCGEQSLTLLQHKGQTQRIERVQAWYTSLVQQLQSSLKVDTCICGELLMRTSKTGRTRHYCSDRCRKRAQRQRDANGHVTK